MNIEGGSKKVMGDMKKYVLMFVCIREKMGREAKISGKFIQTKGPLRERNGKKI